MYYDTDRDVLQHALTWIQAGHHVILVTVAKTWGSSPRPAGSLMIIRDDGQHFGSVSGGCVEEDLIQRYLTTQLSDHYPTLINYGVDRQQASRFGLPCGGRLELIIEQLESAVPLELLLNRIDQGELLTRRLCLHTGEVSLHSASRVDDFDYNDATVNKVFGPAWQLLLIGAGHLSQCVARLALTLNYHVIICDPREEYRRGWEIEQVQLTQLMPDDAVAQLTMPVRSIVLALTHDPKLDDMALMQALTSNYFYVGALGSHRSAQLRRERLLKLGLTSKQCEQLHAPVGLAIGSQTPAEIAIAILAEITAARHHIHALPLASASLRYA